MGPSSPDRGNELANSRQRWKETPGWRSEPSITTGCNVNVGCGANVYQWVSRTVWALPSATCRSLAGLYHIYEAAKREEVELVSAFHPLRTLGRWGSR